MPLPLPEFQIFRKNILHFTSENVLLELKQWCLPSSPRSHDVTVIVDKQVVLHPTSTTSGLGTPLDVRDQFFINCRSKKKSSENEKEIEKAMASKKSLNE